MEIGSGSDSDGSHISATPPRYTSSPSPPPPPPPLCTLPASKIVRAPKPQSNLKSKSSSVPKKPSYHHHLHLDPSSSSLPTPSLSSPLCPFQIHSHTNNTPQNHDLSVENLRAGYLSIKAPSFSKFRKDSLNFESTEPLPPSVLESNSTTDSFKRVVNKHPNLIGGSSAAQPLPPAKKVKCANEGNFVRLNINGYGNNKRKFMNKGKRRFNPNSFTGRKCFRKKIKKGGGDGDVDDAGGSCDEDGLVPNETVQSGKGGLNFDCDVLERAVLACRDEVSDENLVRLLKLVYDYDSFRDGQLDAIKMVLSGKSTMLVLPTGAGKSLCYQLPAMIFPGITIVVSPLVALMIDQLKQLPSVIQGGHLSSSQTAEEVSETLRMLHEGCLKVLFISPERFSNQDFLSVLSSDSLVVSLVVVDEAHCLSEWSHNFRPSYMRLRASLLRATLNTDCILAMTATATVKTLDSVMHALEIPPINLIQTAQMRENLQLSVSLSSNRMKDLMMLMKSSPLKDIQSIVIYCKFQFETDSVSKYLCDSNISAKSYHSGIPAKDRRRTQELFCSNKIRVVVATVAFGMGLDKKDIGAVIHYSLPESLEAYVQEIGRSGRDGRLSYCHLLFDDVTYFKLRSLMYSDGVDEYAVNKFLSEVFSNTRSHGKVGAIVKESASRKYDMKEEVMLTILTQLELGEMQYLRLLPQINLTCTLNFHKTPPPLLANKDIVIAAVLKLSEVKQGQYVFDMANMANSIKVMPAEILDVLQNLKMSGEITYELKDPAYCYIIDSAPPDFCKLAEIFTKWLSEVESNKVRKFDAMLNAIVYAVKSCEKTHGCHDFQHTVCLQKRILDYFSGDDISEVPNKMTKTSSFLRADIKVFLQSNSHAKLTPRAVARIMHGIASPAYPSVTWSKTHFWGRYSRVDFQSVMEAAKAELINSAGKKVD